jgi:hypothetical protein
METSPPSIVAATISAILGALPVPTQSMIRSASRGVGSAVPPPTVATDKAGNVTLT